MSAMRVTRAEEESWLVFVAPACDDVYERAVAWVGALAVDGREGGGVQYLRHRDATLDELARWPARRRDDAGACFVQLDGCELRMIVVTLERRAVEEAA